MKLAPIAKQACCKMKKKETCKLLLSKEPIKGGAAGTDQWSQRIMWTADVVIELGLAMIISINFQQ